VGTYDSETRAALGLVESIIGRFGPRLAGSGACLDAAAALREEAAGCSDRAECEDFAVHPGAFLGFIRLLVVLYLASALLLPFAAPLSALLTSLGLAVLVLGFVLYHGVLDPFWPAKRGRNVTAVLEPRERAERVLIVSGHHDSARVFNFYVDRPELYAPRVYGGIGTYVGAWLLSVLLALFGAPSLVLGAGTAILLAAFLFIRPLWNFASREGTPGAGDNLVASAVGLGVLRHFRSLREAGSGLATTRLVFVSFDAEEAGLRGARAWARAHRAELLATPTVALNMDCLYARSDLRFLTSDINGSVALSEPLAALCVRIAAEAGHAARAEPIAFLTGGTDAAELAKAGVAATTLIGMAWSNETRSSAYHTPADTLEAVDPGVVDAAFGIALALAEALDRGLMDRGPTRDRG